MGWHDPDRTKTCIACGQELPLASFYSYAYTTNQGKRSTRYESRCAACARERRKKVYHSNPALEAVKHREWNERNAEHIKAYRRKRQADPKVKALKAYHQRLRKARMRSGAEDTPEIRAIYARAMEIEGIVARCPVFALPELGYEMHVDHIVPLSKRGKHEPSNLQILPKGINLRKGARYDSSLREELR